jgi:hypothetical protein
MCARPIGMDLMEYYRLLKKIMTYGESGEDGLYSRDLPPTISGNMVSQEYIHITGYDPITIIIGVALFVGGLLWLKSLYKIRFV